jgi:hypothetical protein
MRRETLPRPRYTCALCGHKIPLPAEHEAFIFYQRGGREYVAHWTSFLAQRRGAGVFRQVGLGGETDDAN